MTEGELDGAVRRFFEILVEEARRRNPSFPEEPLTVAEIYQSLVPYREHRNRIGVALNADYEHVLLRLLAGENGYLELAPSRAREAIRRELDSPNPNTALYREYAAAEVRVDGERVRAVAGGEETALDRSAKSPTDPADEEEPWAAAPAEEPDDATFLREFEPPEEKEAEGGDGRGGRAKRAPEGAGEPDESPAEARPPRPERCPGCEAALPSRDDVQYCPYCGADVRVRLCPRCGEELDGDWRFCIACGHEVLGEA